MANANLFQQYLQPARSVVDYSNDYAHADALKNQNAMQALTLQQAANVQGQRNALRELVQSGQVDLNDPTGSARALTAAPDVAPALLKTIQEGKTSAALAAKDGAQAGNFTAEAGKTTFETQQAKRDKAMTDIASFASPQDALAALVGHAQAGDIDATKAQAIASSLQAIKDPGGFAQWQVGMLKGILTPQQNLEMSAPKVDFKNAGGSMVPVQMNAYAPGGIQVKPAGVAAIPITQSADNAANNATSRFNTAANISKDFKVAGLDGQGNFAAVGPGGAPGSAGNQVQQLGDAIGKYQGPESSILARVPPALKGQVLAYVGQTYPDYNPSTYDARTKAARDFTSGNQGNALRSFAVAGQHLDQLGTLVDALDNGNTQIINKISNQIGSQLGSTAPTNFAAAKDVVSKEVTKAIVAGGGGVAERAELAEQMSNAKSPAQLKGVIAQYRNLMSAQHDALVQQRRAAGLPDSTLPAYSAGDVMAPGAFKITHVDGKPQ